MADEIDRAEALGLLGVVLHPGCYTAGQRSAPASISSPTACCELLAARRRGKTMVILEHTAGQGTSLGATFEQLAYILAQDEGSSPPRRLPGHLSPAGIGLRHRVAGRLCGHVRPVRAADWHGTAQGLSPERLEAAARQPRRSSRAHRPGCGRARSVSAPRQRSPLRRSADAARDAERPRAGRPRRSQIDPLDERNLNVLRGLDRRHHRGHGGHRGKKRYGSFLRVLSVLRGVSFSPNTSASNRQTFAPRFHASRGRPALWQVCARNISRSHCRSVATCGSSSPRCQPCSTTRPCAPDFDILRRRQRLERPEQRHLDVQAGQFPGADGREARIRAAGGDRALANHGRERLVRFEMPDTAAQLALMMNGDERSARALQRGGLRQLRRDRRARAFHVARRSRRARSGAGVVDRLRLSSLVNALPQRTQRTRRTNPVQVIRASVSSASSVVERLSKLPNAAAMYPTTADLSPETSPESA